MKLAVAITTILISFGCCALIAAICHYGMDWPRTDSLLAAIIYALAVIGAKQK